MKTRLMFGAIVVSTFVSTTAVADSDGDGDACRSSYEGAQISMNSTDGKSDLLKAREQLRTCLRSSCKDWIVADCSRWLTEVENRIPTVVFAARDTAGRDVTDARVTTKAGEAIVATLDGRSIETNPGAYNYVFVQPDGTRREARVIVREGEKAQVVRAIFDAPPGSVEQGRPVTSPETPGTGAPAMRPLRMLGYGIGGLGVVGLGVGSIFGLMATSAKSSGNCDSAGICDPGTRDDAYPLATVSTVGFVAGGALLAGGIALVLLSPSDPKRTSHSRLAPHASGLAMTW
jgi:hypothetical protein